MYLHNACAPGFEVYGLYGYFTNGMGIAKFGKQWQTEEHKIAEL